MTKPTDDGKSDEKLKHYAKNAIKRHPELDALALNWQKNEAAKPATKVSPWIGALLGMGVYLIAMIVLRDWLRALGIRDGAIASGICGGIAGGSGSLLYHYLYRKRNARLIRKKINEFGTPVCIECGYQMQGTSEPRCPECGEPFSSVEIRGPSEPQG
ncbi:MAG TPA: hypothetical protein PKN33_02320 [Phycisphaerae bacterium]|nr:hypothetical protein [Phycisphaerae bacterium]